MGSEAFHGKEVEVSNTILVSKISSTVYCVSAEVMRRCGLYDGTVAVDEFKVKMEVGTVARSSLADPKCIVNRVVGAGAQFIESGVDLSD